LLLACCLYLSLYKAIMPTVSITRLIIQSLIFTKLASL
jgi:hypothetical protein